FTSSGGFFGLILRPLSCSACVSQIFDGLNLRQHVQCLLFSGFLGAIRTDSEAGHWWILNVPDPQNKPLIDSKQKLRAFLTLKELNGWRSGYDDIDGVTGKRDNNASVFVHLSGAQQRPSFEQRCDPVGRKH